MTEDLVAMEDRKRESAIKKLDKNFGRWYDEIRDVTGVDIPYLKEVASTDLLHAAANGKEFVVEVAMRNPVAPSEGLFTTYKSFRLMTRGGGQGWNCDEYPVEMTTVRDSKTGRERLEPLVVRLPMSRDLEISGVVYPAVSREAMCWKLCRQGIVTHTDWGDCLVTPARYSYGKVLRRAVDAVERQVLKSVEATEARGGSFRFYVYDGPHAGMVRDGFRFPVMAKDRAEAVSRLVRSELILRNAEGDRACLRFSIGDNGIIASLPSDVAISRYRGRRAQREHTAHVLPVRQGRSYASAACAVKVK